MRVWQLGGVSMALALGWCAVPSGASAAMAKAPPKHPAKVAPKPPAKAHPKAPAVPAVVAGQLATDGAGYCVLVKGHAARCWGADDFGQVGNGARKKIVDDAVATQLNGASAVLGSASVLPDSADYQDYCALVNGQAECWGSGAWGQLGNDRSSVAYFAPVDAKGVSTGTFLATDGTGYCAIVKLGHVKCWGYNGVSQTGDGHSGGMVTVPTAVMGMAGARQLASDDAGYCGVVSGGHVRCWGDSSQGVLGDGATHKSPVPVSVPVKGLSSAVQIASDQDGYCARVVGGNVECWGYNSKGELGDGSMGAASDVPVRAKLSGATDLIGADNFYCAIVRGGGARCWGDGSGGRLGDGNDQAAAVPQAVKGLVGATSLYATSTGACAILSSGRAKCWGSDAKGALGDGRDGGSADTAQEVKGLSGVEELASGGGSWCALTITGAFCWGDGSNGQLGNGQTSGHAAVAVPVKGV